MNINIFQLDFFKKNLEIIVVVIALCEIFSEFLIFCNMFREPLGEWNSDIWDTKKLFANTVDLIAVGSHIFYQI